MNPLLRFLDHLADSISSQDRSERRKKVESGFWEKISSRYDEWVEKAFKDQYEVFKPKVASYVKPDDSILEIGTGTGDIVFYIAPQAGKVVGIDISPAMVEVARKKNIDMGFDNVQFCVEDGYDLPFKESCFSKVMAVNSLQTMKEPEKAIDEAMRVLSPGGEFLSITYCYGDASILEQIKLVKWILIYGTPFYWNNFKSKNLVSLFKNAGFEVVEQELVWQSPPVLFLRCRKPLSP